MKTTVLLKAFAVIGLGFLLAGVFFQQRAMDFVKASELVKRRDY
jgi:hypothetical protein